ncbi:MAG: TrmH family RNA methyltransferase [Acetobacteraceae bacterium]
MKPPHNHRPGGPGRGPQDRGPQDRGPANRGPHGQGTGPQDRGPRHSGGEGHRPHGQGGQGQAGGSRPGGGPGQHGPNRYDNQSQRAQGQRSGERQDRPPRFGPRPNDQRGERPQQHDQQRPFRPRFEHGKQDRGGPRPPEAPRGTLWLYGHHAVAAALANPARRLRRLLLTEEAEAALAERLAPPWSVPPERVERGRLDQLLGREAVHQGAVLLADPLPPPSLAQALERPGPLIVLDQVTDPRNVGAILRCAAAFGAAGVITQDRNAPEETGGLAKAASGALETVPLLRAVNIARTIIALKADYIWTVGLDSVGTVKLSGSALAGRRVALVLGAEGTGLRRLTRETCDELAALATKAAMESLNVAAAAAVALYEVMRTE